MRVIATVLAGLLLLAGCETYEQSRSDAVACVSGSYAKATAADGTCAQKRTGPTPYKKI